MKILVVAGFLGAGKTTFIKELLRRTGKSPVILENEYGQNDLDAQDIQNASAQDLKLLEFAEGCVCCTQKDKFSNTILTISASLDPDYLIVEPTGVAKLSSIIAAINKVAYEKIRILKPVVILSPQGYERNMADFGDICTDQLKNAHKIIISKNENTSPDEKAALTQKLRLINKDAQITEEHYSQMDDAWWNEFFLEDGEELIDIEETSTDELQGMAHLTLTDAFLTRLAELVLLLEDILHGELGNIPRAKGVLKVGAEYLRFSLADKMYAITAEDVQEGGEVQTQCVFIGKYLDEANLIARLNSSREINKANGAPKRKKLLNVASRKRKT